MLDVYLDVQNIYNHKSPEGLAYSYDYKQSKPQGGLPILALFGVRADLQSMGIGFQRARRLRGVGSVLSPVDSGAQSR